MTTRYATIDVGTNTALLLVAEARGDRFEPVVERAEITRLGRGVDTSGVLGQQGLDDTVAALTRFTAEARALGAQDIACVATSASRDARNGPAFLQRVRDEAGVEPEIISGDLEAELSYLAAARELGDDDPLVVVDIGGGSTEFIFGEKGAIQYRRSFDVGSVRMTERHLRHDPPSAEERREVEASVDRTLAALPAPPASFRLVGIAGTVTTVYAVSRAIEPYDAARVHLTRMSLDEVRAECDRYYRLGAEERRRLPGMEPKRADVIAAGASILERAMRRLGAHELIVSDRGLRWGLLYRRFGSALER